MSEGGAMLTGAQAPKSFSMLIDALPTVDNISHKYPLFSQSKTMASVADAMALKATW